MNDEHEIENDGGGDGGEEYYDEYTFEPVWVRALYDYDAVNDTEISFKENDIICIIEDFKDGWWKGDFNGNVGRVPANFFEYLNQDYQQQGDYDDDQQQQQYDENGQPIQSYYYDENGEQQYYDQQQQQQQQQYYDENGQPIQYEYSDQQQQYQQQYYEGDNTTGNQGGGDDDEAGDNERKELLRQKRELYKKEMKELQDNLKYQNENKARLGSDVEELEKQRDELEDRIRVFKLLKFINLEIIKTEIDIDVDSDASTTSRLTGIAITQDLKFIRTTLATLKSSSMDIAKKQFDQKLEEIEKKVINNLNLLDSCDNLKKSLLLSLQLFQSTVLEPSLNNSNNITKVRSPTQTQPPIFQLPPISSSSNATNTTTTSSSSFVPTTSTAPNAFFSSPATILSDKDKRKSIKEAKELKKEEKKLEKQEKKLEKQEKKEKKKDDDDSSSPIWKSKK